MLNQLTSERDHAKTVAERLARHNEYLLARLATALGKSVDQLVRDEPRVLVNELNGKIQTSPTDQSDVSRTDSCAGSDSDSSVKKS